MAKLLKSFAFLWILVMVGLIGLTTISLRTPDQLQFNLLALLPDSQEADTQHITKALSDSDLSNQFLILVGHTDKAKARRAFNQLQQGLLDSRLPLKEQASQEAYTQLFSSLYPYRAGFLSASDRNTLLDKQGTVLFRRALAALSAPFSATPDLAGDPFGLFPQYIQSLQPLSFLQLDSQGTPYADKNGKRWYIYKGVVEGSAFSLQFQQDATDALQVIQDALPPSTVLLRTGALFYGAAGAKQAQTEISFIGSLSILLIVSLLLLVFKSLRPLVFACITIGTGFVGGLAATLIVFDSVHILSLVFGLSLMGIAVDYAIHYACAGALHTGTDILNQLFPALPLGVLSSAFGYGLLLTFPFPGIQQMALMTSVGLICSFITVCLWGKYVLPTQKSTSIQKAQVYVDKMLRSLTSHKPGFLLSAGLILLFFGGLFTTSTEDDVKAFQSLDSTLRTEELRIKEILHLPSTSTFFLIEGATLEDRLKTEEKLIGQLQGLNVGGVTALSKLIPSLQKQNENRHLLEDLYKNYATQFYDSLGLDLQPNRREVGLKAPLFGLSDLETLDLPHPWQNLYSPHFQRLFVTDAQNPKALHALAAQYENVRYIDPPQVYSQIFKDYRYMLSLSVGAVVLLIALILSVKFSLRGAFSLLSPIVLAVLGGVGVLSLIGCPLTVFTAMGFILVVCIGVDYALFLYCRKSSSAGSSLLANAMAAFTTLVSFGLLSLSSTMAVSSFGMAVFIGITLCFMTTTLLIGAQRDNRL